MESVMSDTRINFKAPAQLRKWPSLNKQRISASDGARPYLIDEGTLDECIQRFMRMHETHRHLYEIHSVQENIEDRILLWDHVAELSRLRDFLGDNVQIEPEHVNKWNKHPPKMLNDRDRRPPSQTAHVADSQRPSRPAVQTSARADSQRRRSRSFNKNWNASVHSC